MVNVGIYIYHTWILWYRTYILNQPLIFRGHSIRFGGGGDKQLKALHRTQAPIFRTFRLLLFVSLDLPPTQQLTVTTRNSYIFSTLSQPKSWDLPLLLLLVGGFGSKLESTKSYSFFASENMAFSPKKGRT